jgi:hypothetical protein
MTTLPPPGVKEFPADSLEKKIYSIVESFAEFMPVQNDRYRLGYCLFKYVNGEGDEPKIALKSELAEKINSELNKIERK